MHTHTHMYVFMYVSMEEEWVKEGLRVRNISFWNNNMWMYKWIYICVCVCVRVCVCACKCVNQLYYIQLINSNMVLNGNPKHDVNE